MLKKIIILWVLSLSAVLYAGRTLETLGGYKNVEIESVSRRGISIIHSQGVKTLTEDDLSAEDREILSEELAKVRELQKKYQQRRQKRQAAIKKEHAQINVLIAKIGTIPNQQALFDLVDALKKCRYKSSRNLLLKHIAPLEKSVTDEKFESLAKVPPQTALEELLKLRENCATQENFKRIQAKINEITDHIEYLRRNPPETRFFIPELEGDGKLELNWAWSGTYMTTQADFVRATDRPHSWRQSLRVDHEDIVRYVRSFKDGRELNTAIRGNDVLFYEIVYPVAQGTRYYERAVENMAAFYNEFYPCKEPEFQNIIGNYRYVRYYLRGRYRYYICHYRTVFYCDANTIIFAERKVEDGHLQAMRVWSINRNVYNFNELMSSYNKYTPRTDSQTSSRSSGNSRRYGRSRRTYNNGNNNADNSVKSNAASNNQTENSSDDSEDDDSED